VRSDTKCVALLLRDGRYPIDPPYGSGSGRGAEGEEGVDGGCSIGSRQRITVHLLRRALTSAGVASRVFACIFTTASGDYLSGNRVWRLRRCLSPPPWVGEGASRRGGGMLLQLNSTSRGQWESRLASSPMPFTAAMGGGGGESQGRGRALAAELYLAGTVGIASGVFTDAFHRRHGWGRGRVAGWGGGAALPDAVRVAGVGPANRRRRRGRGRGGVVQRGSGGAVERRWRWALEAATTAGGEQAGGGAAAQSWMARAGLGFHGDGPRTNRQMGLIRRMWLSYFFL
jgi:hypothetical protein